MASFHVEEQGRLNHQDNAPHVPPPEDLVSFDDRFAGRTDMERWFIRAEPFDIRYVDATPFDSAAAGPPVQQLWVKTKSAFGR